MINDNNKTYKINLTHIATSYPESIDVPNNMTKDLAVKGYSVINDIISDKFGVDWEDDFFFDGLSHIKF